MVAVVAEAVAKFYHLAFFCCCPPQNGQPALWMRVAEARSIAVDVVTRNETVPGNLFFPPQQRDFFNDKVTRQQQEKQTVPH